MKTWLSLRRSKEDYGSFLWYSFNTLTDPATKIHGQRVQQQALERLTVQRFPVFPRSPSHPAVFNSRPQGASRGGQGQIAVAASSDRFTGVTSLQYCPSVCLWVRVGAIRTIVGSRNPAAHRSSKSYFIFRFGDRSPVFEIGDSLSVSPADCPQRVASWMEGVVFVCVRRMFWKYISYPNDLWRRTFFRFWRVVFQLVRG